MTFCLRYGENHVPRCAQQMSGFTRGCVLRPYLYNAVINVTVDVIEVGRTYALVIAGIRTPWILFVGNHVMATFTEYGCQENIDLGDKFGILD
jgi:hypothetical protein